MAPDSQSFTEARALSTLMACLARGEGSRALPLVRDAWEGCRPEDIEGWLSHAAMARILGEPVNLPTFHQKEQDEALFVITARAWLLWVSGRLDEARDILQRVADPTTREGRETHLMALGPWYQAVQALLGGDREEAMRFFRRSMEVGSQLGTETNEAIQWAFAASFFVHGPTSSDGPWA
jgi:ATP/maltotriose-dependent transcriptional regulator MalT